MTKHKIFKSFLIPYTSDMMQHACIFSFFAISPAWSKLAHFRLKLANCDRRPGTANLLKRFPLFVIIFNEWKSRKLTINTTVRRKFSQIF